ncbi:MAG: ABC transporter permease [Rhizobiales bacterium 65-9]|nr:ABC transporter permease [Hyphomicrobiales bacterium]OJY38892.1 MAG: ABC transporter permease [Rhizobiales bacterium 65-9]
MSLAVDRAAEHHDTLAQRVRRVPLPALIGLAVIAINIVVAIGAPLIAPFGQSEIAGPPYNPPDGAFLLGTDAIGRDMLSRIIYGARNTIGIALMTTLLSFFLGAGAGFVAATAGGWVDQILSRAVDVMISIPKLIFALMILSILGASIPTMIITIAVLDSTRIFRLSRSLAINVNVLDFVEVARLRGENTFWIVRKEILPNVTAPLLAEFGLRFTFVFLFISSLGFLGLGIQPPAADWGSMVKDNSTLITFGSLIALAPALAIAILALAVNFVVDWAANLTSGLKD